MTLATGVAPLMLTLWREHDVALLDEPGVALGTRPATGDPVELGAELYERGVRRVALSRPVDFASEIDPPTLIWTMLLLRELSARCVVVDWRLKVGPHTDIWQRLNHLYPPAELIDHPDADAVRAEWVSTFYVCKCVFRRGPGFVEVRDRRSGVLNRFVVDDPDYLVAIDALHGGVAAAEIPAEILAAFVEEGLAGTIGPLAWWLPYRQRRWPWPAMVV